jgi:D-alanyl-D-alanine carboxypeptidase
VKVYVVGIMIVIFAIFFPFQGQVFAETMDAKLVNIGLEIDKPTENRNTQMIVHEGVKYYPLRELMGAAGRSVTWDQRTKEISIKGEAKNNRRLLLEEVEAPETLGGLSFTETIGSEGAIVMEDNKHGVMFEKNSLLKFYPASTVKIMTALLALENGRLDDVVTVTESIDKLPYDSRLANIRPGDRVTLKQLLIGMLIYSGNDSALAIAEHIAGSEEEFVKLMNDKVEKLGAKNTQFANSHGYHDENQYTTPYDLALIAKEAAKNETFMELIKIDKFKASYKNDEGKNVNRYWKTTNKFLKGEVSTLDGIIGGKTGYTDASRYNLVTFAEKKGHTYVSVVLKGNNIGRYEDSKKLLAKAFETRKAFEMKSEKNINISYPINKVSVNGNSISPKKDIFVYRGSSYVSESFAKRLLKPISFIRNQTKDVLSLLSMIQMPTVSAGLPAFPSVAFRGAQIAALVNFKQYTMNRNASAMSALLMKPEKIKVRILDEYLAYRPLKL